MPQLDIPERDLRSLVVSDVGRLLETGDPWEEHYASGRGFRPLSESERALLAEHTPRARRRRPGP